MITQKELDELRDIIRSRHEDVYVGAAPLWLLRKLHAAASRALELDKLLSDQLEHIDLMADEFKRIKSLCYDNGEIAQLCDRAITNTKQHYPLIVQRDRAEGKAESLQAKIYNLEQALAQRDQLIAELEAALEFRVKRARSLNIAREFIDKKMSTISHDQPHRQNRGRGLGEASA